MKPHCQIIASLLCVFGNSANAQFKDRKPFITTQSPITLFSTQDGETEAILSFSDGRPYDYKLLTQDALTIIHLGPGHPPVVKTIYGTPTMAVSTDGRYSLVANHGFRFVGNLLDKLTYPADQPLRNRDLTPELLKQQELSPQLADIISVVDLHDPDHPVADLVK